uniref:Carbamoyltransferase domain-containing protein n=1 Tax=Emiliania huxleyi TaxID=2903 RepID=A0A7S3TD05_EMIHU
MAVATLSSTLSSVLAVTTPPRLVVGLNKYSHDAAATVLDANSGRVRYSAARERLTRKKHDGGGCGALVAAGVASAGGTLCDVAAVVANNHHAPIAPLERRLAAWAESSNAGDEMISRLDVANLLPEVPRRIEISHHLAHAAAASATAPFDSGLVVVMDGMGERRSDLVGRAAGAAPLDRVDYSAAEWPEYVSDALLPGYDTCVQAGAAASDAARESESAYLFETVAARGGRRRPRLQRGRGGGRGGEAHAARESGRSPSPAGTACCGPCNLPTSPHISPHLQAPRAATRVQAVGRRDVPARLLRLVPRL